MKFFSIFEKYLNKKIKIKATDKYDSYIKMVDSFYDHIKRVKTVVWLIGFIRKVFDFICL